MKTCNSMMAILLAAGMLSACGGTESKSGCNTDNDCTSSYRCNEGTCMKVSTRGDSQGQFLCTASEPCPSGQFCFNGLCVPGCMSDEDCAENQYCDTGRTQMCLNKEVSGCSDDSQCAENQTCVMGLCSASVESKQCTPRADGQDGCDKYSICLDVSETEQEQLACVSFPPCPQDGNCPVGQVGSVCNEGDIPGKERICLTSLCKTAANCPNGFKCVSFSATLGMCSNGTMGMPCATSADCQESLSCTGAMPGVPGFCMMGAGGDCESSGGTCVDMMGDCPNGTTPSAEQCPNFSDLCCK